MFKERQTIKQVEEGNDLAPKFDDKGFIPVVTTDAKTGIVLMHAYMNQEALEKKPYLLSKLIITVEAENACGIKALLVV